MSHILLVEDDPILGRSLSITLELEGYKVSWAKDLRYSRSVIDNTAFDLVLLDINLPDGSGLRLCVEIREKNKEIPIIFLTAKSDEDSIVAGFNAGANDYVKKPFGTRELIARIKANLRSGGRIETTLRFGELTILQEKRQVFADDKEIVLNRREFDILRILVLNCEAVVTREGLLRQLDRESEIFDRTIDSHISHIRSKLRKMGVNSIQLTSVYGIGYRLEKTSTKGPAKDETLVSI